jgi:hypothetical protein
VTAQPASKIDNDPPDFIVNGGDQVDTKRQK